ncbi:hypothetical protein NE237_032546 [Protea cynaroides]|uniref:Pentatricopeptide repeat-containing protein n=1 Tax=Protea cynaroides TaxID=273540 RepID=A0A9Q0L3K3_9MAGN|nr:hypothetical protein NE237_032546 [Protea cynaroides]
MGSHSSNHQRLLYYTKLLMSHVNQGCHEQVLLLFSHMNASLELSLNPFAFPLALKSCATLIRPHLGTTIHSRITKISLLSNPFVGYGLIDMYGKCVPPQRNVIMWNAMISLYSHSKDVSTALHLFDLVEVSPNASSFYSIIAALSESDDGSSKALAFYRRMEASPVKPTLFTLLALLPACVELAALNLIKEIHGYSIRNGIDLHAHLCSGLVEAYGRCWCLVYACYIFERMSDRDAETTFAISKQMELAKVRPDGITFLRVFKAYSHAGLTNEALKYLEQMRMDYGVVADNDHYYCLIDVLSRTERLYEAYEIIKEMPVKATTYGEVELAKIASRSLFEIEHDNLANYVLLATIYSNVGRLDEAERLRKEMYERGVKKMPDSSRVVYHN